MEAIIISTIQKFGYIGIMLLIAIENLFPPIPSELILAFSSFIAPSLNLNLFLIIIFSTLGSLIGAIILYFLGSKLMHRLNATASIKFFEEKGIISILLCRFIPILRSLISIPAGIYKVNFYLFLILTTIGSIIWNTVIILIGNILGSKWTNISHILSTYKHLLLIILFIFIIYKILKRVKH